jgi:mRNA-degrading endonuclease HigB of HigAB toxin-antitoxin module
MFPNWEPRQVGRKRESMRVIARPILRAFAETHPDLEERLDSWYHLMRATVYRDPHELRYAFPEVSLLGDGITVFNIGSCRIEARIRYEIGIVFIRSIDTHADYDRRNARRKK